MIIEEDIRQKHEHVPKHVQRPKNSYGPKYAQKSKQVNKTNQLHEPKQTDQQKQRWSAALYITAANVGRWTCEAGRAQT